MPANLNPYIFQEYSRQLKAGDVVLPYWVGDGPVNWWTKIGSPIYQWPYYDHRKILSGTDPGSANSWSLNAFLWLKALSKTSFTMNGVPSVGTPFDPGCHELFRYRFSALSSVPNVETEGFFKKVNANCSIEMWRGQQYGQEFYGGMFMNNPVSSGNSLVVIDIPIRELYLGFSAELEYSMADQVSKAAIPIEEAYEGLQPSFVFAFDYKDEQNYKFIKVKVSRETHTEPFASDKLSPYDPGRVVDLTTTRAITRYSVCEMIGGSVSTISSKSFRSITRINGQMGGAIVPGGLVNTTTIGAANILNPSVIRVSVSVQYAKNGKWKIRTTVRVNEEYLSQFFANMRSVYDYKIAAFEDRVILNGHVRCAVGRTESSASTVLRVENIVVNKAHFVYDYARGFESPREAAYMLSLNDMRPLFDGAYYGPLGNVVQFKKDALVDRLPFLMDNLSGGVAGTELYQWNRPFTTYDDYLLFPDYATLADFDPLADYFENSVYYKSKKVFTDPLFWVYGGYIEHPPGSGQYAGDTKLIPANSLDYYLHGYSSVYAPSLKKDTRGSVHELYFQTRQDAEDTEFLYETAPEEITLNVSGVKDFTGDEWGWNPVYPSALTIGSGGFVRGPWPMPGSQRVVITYEAKPGAGISIPSLAGALNGPHVLSTKRSSQLDYNYPGYPSRPVDFFHQRYWKLPVVSTGKWVTDVTITARVDTKQPDGTFVTVSTESHTVTVSIIEYSSDAMYVWATRELFWKAASGESGERFVKPCWNIIMPIVITDVTGEFSDGGFPRFATLTFNEEVTVTSGIYSAFKYEYGMYMPGKTTTNVNKEIGIARDACLFLRLPFNNDDTEVRLHGEVSCGLDHTQINGMSARSTGTEWGDGQIARYEQPTVPGQTESFYKARHLSKAPQSSQYKLPASYAVPYGRYYQMCDFTGASASFSIVPTVPTPLPDPDFATQIKDDMVDNAYTNPGGLPYDTINRPLI